jgi:hypothetical protein
VTVAYTEDRPVFVVVVVNEHDEDSAMTEAARPARAMVDLIIFERMLMLSSLDRV